MARLPLRMVPAMAISVRQILISGLALLAACGAGSAVSAQRLIVVTEARNAAGNAVSLTAHSADFDAGILPGGFTLPGTALTAPLVLDGERGAVLHGSGPPWRGGALEARHLGGTLGALRAAPFNPWPEFDREGEPGWRVWPVTNQADPNTLSNLLISAAVRRDDEGAWRGLLRARPWPPEGTAGRVQAPGGDTPLALGPRFVIPLASGACLALGFDDTEGDALIQRVEPATGRAGDLAPLSDGTFPAALRNLAAAALLPEETTLWVLFSSLALQAEGTQPQSWLVAYDTRTLTRQGAPLAIPGVAAPGFQALTTAMGGHCWAATRTPGTDFAQVSKATLESTGPVLAQSWAIVGLQQSLAVTAHPTSGDLAVAVDHRLARWPGGERKDAGHAYEAPIARVRWLDGSLLVGEGNRLHHTARADGAPERTLALQSGWVSDFVALDPDRLPRPDADADGLDDQAELRQQTKPDNPDTDGDGVPDGSDPFPNAPSPQLRVGAEVVFPHSAVGRQLRALQIESLGDPDAQWRIDFDAEAMPWLRIHPRNFRGTGQAYMGIDPERYDPAGVTSGTIQISLAGRPRGSRPGYTAAYSPATVHVRVEPPRSALRSILWLWPADGDPTPLRDSADPWRLRGLSDLAGGYPMYFSQAEHHGPIHDALDAYALIIVSARAAAEGALTQQALLDYLAGGGAVLLLGEYLTGEQFRDLRPWLAPLGVEMDLGTAVQGAFEATAPHELLRHWTGFNLAGGGALTTRWEDGIRVPADNGRLAFFARPHGYGRLAVLAAATPLESAALATEANRAFALDLLYWLSRAGYAVEDRDGDGLLDATEDTNNNGAVDPGETDWLGPDTDRDGIPDGEEDANRNGQVDPGETDPRKADTDGDGTPDGADATPLASGN